MAKCADRFQTLDDLLDAVKVVSVGSDTSNCPNGWYALVDESGVVAYFCHEEDAFSFRLVLVNARLNGGDMAARYATGAKDDSVPGDGSD